MLPAAAIEPLPLLAGLAGGLALFLFGMEQLTRALQVAAGERLRWLLERLARNRLTGALTGAGVTSVIQSSSITTVLVVGFVSAGLLPFARAVPVILGANVGSTVTAHLVAFDLGEWALVLVAAGFLTATVAKGPATHYGTTALGLGLVLFGMSVMGEAVTPLREHEPFLEATTGARMRPNHPRCHGNRRRRGSMEGSSTGPTRLAASLIAFAASIPGVARAPRTGPPQPPTPNRSDTESERTRMTTFRELGLSAALVDTLAEQGIEEAFPIQEATIVDALAGADVCGKAKTGSGKTLAFGLPLLQRVEPAVPGKPTALILVPTRELAKQVVGVLSPLGKSVGARVADFYGGTSMDRQLRNLQRRIEVAVATPGRLIDLLERKEMDLDAITTLVIDEADRMADMGFLPQVEWILRRIPTDRQTMLFSATLDREVDVLVRRYMRDPVRHEVESTTDSFDEMTHRFLKVHDMDRVKVLGAISAGVPRTMVFVRTKRGADRLVSQLKREGVRADAIHGDLRQSAREKALRDFASGDHALLVATDVAARGIHVDEVDVVVHWDPPEDHKSYLHRSGRTARAGLTGIVVTFVLWNQELDVEKLQRRLGLRMPIIEVFSNDPRLADLESLDAPAPSRRVAGVS